LRPSPNSPPVSTFEQDHIDLAQSTRGQQRRAA